MGQQITKPGRRRLALADSRERKDKWFEFRRITKYQEFGEEKKEGMVLRLFGLHNYGYGQDRMCYTSWATWVLETWASFSINVLEAAAILGITIYLQEHPEWWPKNRRHTQGASYIYNVQAGYVWYHYFIRGRRDWVTWAATWTAIGADLSSVLSDAGFNVFEKPEQLTSHFHHYIGATEGMTAAFFLDWLRPRGGSSRTFLMLLVPFITIGMMVIAGVRGDEHERAQLSSEDRLSPGDAR